MKLVLNNIFQQGQYFCQVYIFWGPSRGGCPAAGDSQAAVHNCPSLVTFLLTPGPPPPPPPPCVFCSRIPDPDLDFGHPLPQATQAVHFLRNICTIFIRFTFLNERIKSFLSSLVCRLFLGTVSQPQPPCSRIVIVGPGTVTFCFGFGFCFCCCFVF